MLIVLLDSILILINIKCKKREAYAIHMAYFSQYIL